MYGRSNPQKVELPKITCSRNRGNERDAPEDSIIFREERQRPIMPPSIPMKTGKY